MIGPITKEVKVRGEFEVCLYDESMRLKAYRKIKNITTNTGVTAVAQQMGATSSVPAQFTYCAVGTGNIAPAVTLTTMATDNTHIQGAWTTTGAAASGIVTWTNITTFGAGTATAAITESGLFDTATTNAQTMLCYNTFAVINKGASDTLVITWQYTISSS